MKIELRNIKTLAGMSEETHCYTATLYVDGIKTAEVGNDGHGGCDRVYPIDRAQLARAEAYIKTLPPIEFHDTKLDQSLEIICGDLVNDHLTLKDLRRKLKTNVLAQKADGKVYQWKLKKGWVLETVAASIIAKNPDAKILNTMAEAEALAIYKAIGA